MALINKLNAIGDAIREKTGKTELLTLDEMPVEIESIQGGGEGYIHEGTMKYMFFDYTNYDSNVADDYKTGFGILTNAALNGIKDTKNVSSAYRAFYENPHVKEVPFAINLVDGASLNDIFNSANNLLKCPKITGKIGAMQNPFYYCYYLADVSALEDVEFNNEHGTDGRQNMFSWCSALRHVPESFACKIGHNRNGYYYLRFFSYCVSLDEVTNLGVNGATMTSNGFSETFNVTSRLKRMTFETNEDGTPKTAKWHTQKIAFTGYVGYMNGTSYTKYAGFTEDTRVTDDATYQALKDNPDYWTTDINYSRYNHDSAVETINSLPDTSAYLATQSGKTNTIAFKGAQGALTDGGAINTLTEEEIAVAAAKGWTVSLA